MRVEEEGVGDAAFYGPKLDFMAKDSLGRQWQVATIQLDFAQPEGLDLTYANEEGELERPVMIHCAIMGSIERFLAILIEHTGGKFPVWLAPEQLRVASLNDEEPILNLAKNVVKKAKELGLRAGVDESNESVSKKIHDAQAQKVPYVLVIGGKEVETGKVTPRGRNDLGEQAEADIDEFLQKTAADAKARSL